MAEQGQPQTPEEKRTLWEWGIAFVGVMLGALLGVVLLGQAVNNPPVAALLGAVIGGAAGFGAPRALRPKKAH